MDGFTPPSDADRELAELRARAYGPNHDIDSDPRALARLRELEAARLADVEKQASAPTSDSSTGAETAKVTRTWRGRLAWAAAALVVAGAVVVIALLISARPDSTLRPTATKADDRILTHVTLDERARFYEIDPSTLRSYGSYHGLQIWSGVNAFGSPCLVAVHRATDNLSEARCAPLPADLIMDVSSSGDGFDGFDMLPGDGIIRFIFRGETVDAYIHVVQEDF